MGAEGARHAHPRRGVGWVDERRLQRIRHRLKTLGPTLALLLVGCGVLPSQPPATAEAPLDAADLASALIRFALEPGPGTIRDVPLADEVSLGLGDQVLALRRVEDLVDPRAWMLDPGEAGFRGRVGPFTALDHLAQAGRQTVVVVGRFPRCANPEADIPPAPGAEGLNRVAIRPALDAISTCILWWSVDLYVTPEGEIAGVTLDLWDP